MEPLLKLEPPQTLSEADPAAPTPRRPKSIPAARLARARRTAAGHFAPPSAAHPAAGVLPALMRHVSSVAPLLHAMLPPSSPSSPSSASGAVSEATAGRAEVATLHARLMERLAKRRARPNGVCPIRREIYAEVFDELIRQVTIAEPARGVLLLRLRDEMHLTLDAHRALYERSMWFALRQAEKSPDGLDALRAHVATLEAEREELQVRLKMVQLRHEHILHAHEEERNASNKVRQDEASYYRRTNHQLSQRLKAETDRTSAAGVQALASSIGVMGSPEMENTGSHVTTDVAKESPATPSLA